MNEDNVKQEIGKTLALLDAAPHVKANPYFYTRLKARMEKEERTQGRLARVVHNRVLLAAVGFVLLVIINIFSLVHLSTRSSEVQKAQTLASFAEEYNLSHSQY
jgi:hypothetical protein